MVLYQSAEGRTRRLHDAFEWKHRFLAAVRCQRSRSSKKNRLELRRAPNTEMHTAYPLGKERVLIMQNGSPAKLLILRKRDNRIEKELELPTASSKTHGQFRHVRMTDGGTLFRSCATYGSEQSSRVRTRPKEIWSVNAPSAWAGSCEERKHTDQREPAWLRS
jgi:hypothetical protein